MNSKFCFFLILFIYFFKIVLSDPPKPIFPEKYKLQLLLSIPTGGNPDTGIYEDIIINYDNTTQKMRLDFYQDLATEFYVLQETPYRYQVVIANDKKICVIAESYIRPTSLYQFLPDLTNFTYKSITVVRGYKVYNFEFTETIDGVTNYFNYYCTADSEQRPIRFRTLGYSEPLDSDYDLYIIDYLNYTANYTDENAFIIPEICNSSNSSDSIKTNQSLRSGCGLTFMNWKPPFPRMKPINNDIDNNNNDIDNNNKFEEFTQKYNKQYSSNDEKQKRKTIFQENVEWIEKFNQENSHLNYKLGVNKFADLSREEIKEILQIHQKPKKPSEMKYARTYEYQGIKDLPQNFDWRDYGAVTWVKDQVACGSCWAFSAIGAIETQYILKYGKQKLFSENQLMDCTWDFGNEGCNGGWPWSAYDSILARDSVFYPNEIYGPYIGWSGYCKEPYLDKSDGIKLAYYYNITPGDIEALKEAVYLYGAVAVSIDYPESMMFYRSGVFSDPKCHTKLDDLLHCVTLVGYGTENEEDYWLIKNSFSANWGDEGYIKILRDNNMCGVATCPQFPVLG
ncbi:peptidase c1a family protein [Anaeramoeba ignava]|uniref:Peptidase c1a family protein n=1 Tax=Anaeramoeba ignava TaxID=1746090 RepID=A0A9Q0L588_ANAIG|nr:peptidase c1a family protein [Anaeramoeba ignava]